MSLSCRWKVDGEGEKVQHSESKQPILQFVSIKRKDCGEWAIPGVGGIYISFSSFIDELCCFPLYFSANFCSHIVLFYPAFHSPYHSYSRMLRDNKK